MSTELMQWAWEATLWASLAIALVVPVRWVLGRFCGARTSLLAWTLVPLVCVVTVLPSRTVEISVPLDAVPAMSASAVSVAATQSVQPAPQMQPAVMVTAWVVGALVWLLLFALRQHALDREIGRRHCRGRICFSEAARIGPMVLGVTRPKVVLPRDFRTRFSRAQQRLVLAHELTHIRRHDPLWNLVAVVFQCLLWFNPLVHWAASRFRRDQELACDEAVLESRLAARRDYANALLQLDCPSTFGALAFGAHPLKERIMMLTRMRHLSSNRRRLGRSLTALLALGIGVAAWAADTETRAAADALFAFDITVTVDGVREEGTLTVTGDSVIKPVDGEPVFLARERLLFEHESEDSGWSADIELTRAGDKTFWVSATVLKNGQVVAASKNIIKSDAPLSIEQADLGTGAGTYRIDIAPVDVPSFGDAKEEAVPTARSAQVFLSIDEATAMKRIEWPRGNGETEMVAFNYAGEAEPWDARLVVEGIGPDKVKMCIDSIELGDLSTGGGCMMFDRETRDNAYMMGSLGETGIPLRLDMVPNMHE
ncbi:MAG: hypothetical protein KGY48_05710 [Wenzhouxiangellaceae bacterium]|nr:hypothetical protein [Wenzhouxiangellaceae bacterium]MBS3747115.1 hypothetical protein [Wenzhouxiangellaceae bacterium]